MDFAVNLTANERNFLRFQDATVKIADHLRRERMKRIHTWRAIAMGLGLGLGGSILVLHAQNQPVKSKAEATSGQQARAAFENVCAACHGLDGRGGERGPDIVSRRESVSRADADLLSVLKEGRTSKGMPAFGALGEKQLLALVGYLRELQGAGKPKSASGDPARGRELFFGKAKCSECHMVAGQGGFFASELTGFAAKKGTDELRTAILSPEKDRDPRKGPVTVKLVDATVLTGMPRNEDNFSLQLQSPDGSFHLIKKADIVSLTRSGHSAMSADHGRTLSASDLDDLMGFLVRTAGSESGNKSSSNPDDGEDE
jgi:cytochrome c oxidase cbb3-type subunit III